MDLVFFNAWWMTFNVSLGIIGVISGWIVIKTQSNFLKFIFGILWLLFIPNTIYMITDLQHLIPHLELVTPLARPLIFVEFMLLTVIGICTFILGMYPFELFLQKLLTSKNKVTIYTIITATLILISLGVVLGRFYRIHSWKIFTNIPLVINSTISIFSSPSLILFVLIFGIGSSLLYFGLRKPTLDIFYKFLFKFNLQKKLYDKI